MKQSNPVGIYSVDCKWITVTMLGVYVVVNFYFRSFSFFFCFWVWYYMLMNLKQNKHRNYQDKTLTTTYI